MQDQQRNNIQKYFNEAYITSVTNFEKTIIWAQSNQPKIQIQVSRIDRLKLRPKHLKQLKPGTNRTTYVQLSVLRAFYCQKVLYVLVVDGAPTPDTNRFLCLIMPWKHSFARQISYGMTVIIKQPYLATQLSHYLKVCFTRIENLIPQGKYQSKSPQILKQKGNQFFKNDQFYKALIAYQFALCNATNSGQCKIRAILYSNSSACLYGMSLYETSIHYANIAIKIDNSYPKSYAWKINSLLQLKYFSQVPKCLINLYQKVEGQQLSKLNKRYTNYIKNSIGSYDWSQIYSRPSSKLKQFASYQSQKIELKQQSTQYPYYYAVKDIKQYQLLIVDKPLIYFRTGQNFLKQFQKISNQVSLYTSLQLSFYNDLKKLPCLCHPNKPLEKDQMLHKLQLIKKLQRALFIQRYIEKLQGQIGYGVWKQMVKFKQDCQPNCCYVHFKSAFICFASKKINKGEILSIDLFADLQALKRQEVMKQKIGIFCQCQACAYDKWPTNYFGKLQGFFQLTDSFKTNKLKKQMIWHIICRRKLNNSQYSVQNYYPQTMDRYSWEDILNILRVLRGQQDQQIKTNLYTTLIRGLSNYLHIPVVQAQKFIKLIH